MTAELLIHPATHDKIQAFIQKPSHALVLIGPSGSGKLALAQQLAADLLSVEQLNNYPYIKFISPIEGKAISIDEIRQLEHFLSLKVPRQAGLNRAIIIQDAHLMTLEAQNALLKTLEEPPEATVIILTVSNPQSLLPTVRSRTQSITVSKPSKQAAEDFFQPADIRQAYAISGGLPGLMSSLMNEENHPLTEATAMARQLLSQSAYERLMMVDQLAKDRQLAADTAFILQQMAHTSLQSASGATAKRWQNILKTSFEAAEALNQNAQPKLVLTNLMLNI